MLIKILILLSGGPLAVAMLFGAIILGDHLGEVLHLIRPYLEEGPRLPTGVLVLWVPLLLTLNAFVALPTVWLARRTGRLLFSTSVVAVSVALVLSIALAADSAAKGNELETLAVAFCVLATAIGTMIATGYWIWGATSNKPLQPTRAAKPFGKRETARVGPRG